MTPLGKIIVGLVMAIIAGGAGYVYYSIRIEDRPVACTADVQLCPDGSYVGRVPPNCEFAACPEGTGEEISGTIAGKVSIGPLCPVVREGEDCEQPEVYLTRQIMLTPKGEGRVLSVPLSVDGTFNEKVPVGNYELTLTDCNYLSCKDVLPKTVTIQANSTTEINIEIDTGIR